MLVLGLACYIASKREREICHCTKQNGRDLLDVVTAINGALDTLPTGGQSFTFQRMRPVRGFGVVIDVVLPAP